MAVPSLCAAGSIWINNASSDSSGIVKPTDNDFFLLIMTLSFTDNDFLVY